MVNFHDYQWEVAIYFLKRISGAKLPIHYNINAQNQSQAERHEINYT